MLSTIVRLLLLPLTIRQHRETLATRALQPEVEALRKQHADDPAKMQAALAALYRERGVNPATGCLLTLIQAPIFWAVYSAVLAASHEPTATNLVGISVTLLSSLVWLLAALLGGVAGILTGPLSGFGPGFLTFSALVAAFTAPCAVFTAVWSAAHTAGRLIARHAFSADWLLARL